MMLGVYFARLEVSPHSSQPHSSVSQTHHQFHCPLPSRIKSPRPHQNPQPRSSTRDFSYQPACTLGKVGVAASASEGRNHFESRVCALELIALNYDPRRPFSTLDFMNGCGPSIHLHRFP